MRKFIKYAVVSIFFLGCFAIKGNAQFKEGAFTQTYNDPADTTGVADTTDKLFSFHITIKKVTDDRRARIMKHMLLFAPIVFVSYLVSLCLYGHDAMRVMVSPLNSYITDLPNVILMISLALFLFAVLYYLCRAIDKSRFMNFMMKISTYIVPFYMLQWVLVSWMFYGMDLLQTDEGILTLPWFLIAAALITGICIYVSVKHGMRATKFLARLSAFKFKRKKKVVKR